jgi:hypothetical protein
VFAINPFCLSRVLRVFLKSNRTIANSIRTLLKLSYNSKSYDADK